MTHCMFADDTTLFASTRRGLATMIDDVQVALSEHGLNLNLGKCMVQTNCQQTTAKDITVTGHRIPIVSAEIGFTVLGTQFSVSGRTSAEVRARIKKAWGKFHQLWPVLGKKEGNIAKRLRLFDMTVTQTVLWCNESWLLTANEKRLLKSTQNEMLRRIAGPRRITGEDWVSWIKRSTRAARIEADGAKIRWWLQTHLACKWGWAGHVVRRPDSRLAKQATEWRDSAWWARELETSTQALRLHRPRRERWFRWEDDLRKFAASNNWSSWQDTARKRNVWSSSCDSFVKFVMK